MSDYLRCPECKGQCCEGTTHRDRVPHTPQEKGYAHVCTNCPDGFVFAARTAEDNLVRVLRRVIDENKLREAHGEDTLGVLMKCGAFHDTEVAALAARIDAVEL
jgi:hypothetical protein